MVSTSPCSARGPDISRASRRAASRSTIRPFRPSAACPSACGRAGVLGLLGPNGSGKSTTVSILAGLLEPSGGTIRLNGRDVRDDLLGYKAQIGYVPEEAVLYTYLTGPEYLSLIGNLRGLAPATLEARIDGFMSLFGLERRQPRAALGLLEGHAAEDPDLRRAPAQPGDRHPRRAELRPRRDDDVRSAEPDPDAGGGRTNRGLQLARARERRARRDRRDHPQRRPRRRARFGLPPARAHGAWPRSSRSSGNSSSRPTSTVWPAISSR